MFLVNEKKQKWEVIKCKEYVRKNRSILRWPNKKQGSYFYPSGILAELIEICSRMRYDLSQV